MTKRQKEAKRGRVKSEKRVRVVKWAKRVKSEDRNQAKVRKSDKERARVERRQKEAKVK